MAFTAFIDVFGAQDRAVETLTTYLPVADATRLGRTCRSMHGRVGSCLSPSKVDDLAKILTYLPSERPFSLEWAPKKCRENRTFVELAIQRDSANYVHAGSFQKDIIICKIALISAKLFNPQEVEKLLKLMGPEISDRPDVRAILEANIPADRSNRWLRQGLCCLRDQKFLGTDRELLLKALQQDGETLPYASPNLRGDREVVLTAVRQNGMTLFYASTELRADREVVLAAVRQNGRALFYASHELRADKEVVLTAVRQNGMALFHASPELRADEEVVSAAVQQNKEALACAIPKVQASKDGVSAMAPPTGL